MSIKNLKPSGNSGFVQGYYTPENPDKYIGPTPIIYRSSWERKFCIMCDTKDNVLKWSSEPVKIKYRSTMDKKEHTYYPDFYMKTKGEDGPIEWLVEIKPEAQIKKPLPPKTKSKKALNSYKFLAEQYVKNTDKYKYAQAWCESRNMRFIVLTEKTLK